jgi:hypothetical protein
MTKRKTLWTWGMPTPDLGRNWRRDGSRYYVDVTDEYVSAEQLRGAVDALRDLADAVSIACGSRLTDRDAALADKADEARRLVGGQ